jgi:hypothetical protein
MSENDRPDLFSNIIDGDFESFQNDVDLKSIFFILLRVMPNLIRHLFYYFLCLETKKQNSRLYQIMLKITGCQADALNSLRSNTKSSSHLPARLMHLYFSRII